MRNEIFNEMFYQVEADPGQVFCHQQGVSRSNFNFIMWFNVEWSGKNFIHFWDLEKIVHEFVWFFFGNSALKLCGWSFDNIFRWDNEKGTHEVKVVFGYEYSLQILSKLYFVVWISENFKNPKSLLATWSIPKTLLMKIKRPNHKSWSIAWLILNKHEFLRNTWLFSIKDILRFTNIQHLTWSEHPDDWRHIIQLQIWSIKS
jgi:hypothetical protein